MTQSSFFILNGTTYYGSLSNVLDATFGGTQGDILYRNATQWTVLAPGTSGQVLQTQGPGANPQWANAAGGGGTPGGTSGQLQWNNGGVFAGLTVSGDGTLTTGGVLTITKTNGVAFAASATTDTTNAANISSGTLPGGRLPADTGDVTRPAGSTVTTLANIPNDVTMAGDLLVTAIAAPATPAAGKGRIYEDSTNKVLALKNDAGTVSNTVVPSSAGAHQFATALSAAGVLTWTQPAFTDISGNISTSQMNSGTSASSSTFWRGDGTWATPAGGGSPSAPTTSVQFNNSGSFGGDSGFTYAGSGQATLALGTITANAKALNITGTWNNAAVTFDAPIFMNITNTASAVGSSLLDFQIGGVSWFNIQINSNSPAGGGTSNDIFMFGKGGNSWIGLGDGSSQTVAFGWGTSFVSCGAGTALVRNSSLLVGNNFGVRIGDQANPIDLYTDAVNYVLAVGKQTNASGLRVYNTTDQTGLAAPTNFERGVFDWTTTANQLTIGVQVGGTGTTRNVLLKADNTGGHVGLGVFGGVWACLLSNTGNFSIGGALTLGSGAAVGFAPTVDTTLSRTAAGVAAFGTSNTIGDHTGWMQWAGETRVTADVTFTSTTTLGTVTGLSVNVQAGRTYAFEAQLFVTDAAAGGVQAAIAGTATATAIQYTGWTVADNAIKAKTNATALATAVGSTVTTETSGIMVQIYGTITVNAAGTLLVQAAQNTSNATATTIKRGSYFRVYDCP